MIRNLTGKCTFSFDTLSDDTVQQLLKKQQQQQQQQHRSSYHIPGLAKYRSSKDSLISSFDREILVSIGVGIDMSAKPLEHF